MKKTESTVKKSTACLKKQFIDRLHVFHLMPKSSSKSIEQVEVSGGACVLGGACVSVEVSEGTCLVLHLLADNCCFLFSVNSVIMFGYFFLQISKTPLFFLFFSFVFDLSVRIFLVSSSMMNMFKYTYTPFCLYTPEIFAPLFMFCACCSRALHMKCLHDAQVY